MPCRTALIVPVPEAQPYVRITHVRAHVTILVPFAPLAELDTDALRALLAAHPAFDFVLDEQRRWPEGVVWLHPEPSEPFAALTRAVWKRWPAYPPYEGAYDEINPHLTLSTEDEKVDVPLPIACRASEVALLEEEAPEVWRERMRFQLGQGVA